MTAVISKEFLLRKYHLISKEKSTVPPYAKDEASLSDELQLHLDRTSMYPEAQSDFKYRLQP